MTMQDPRVLRDDAGAVDAVGLQSLYPACAERDQGGALGLAGVRRPSGGTPAAARASHGLMIVREELAKLDASAGRS